MPIAECRSRCLSLRRTATSRPSRFPHSSASSGHFSNSRTTRSASFTARSTFVKSALPPSFFVTLSTGQPMLMSTIVAPCSTAQRAPWAMISGSLPYSCMPIGLSTSFVRARSRLVAVPRRRPCGLSKSVHASPTPPYPRHTVRNARSQYPAMGASKSGVANSTCPSLSVATSRVAIRPS
jgi:hypothetical protein